MTFTVTQKHINHGIRTSSRWCPLARAAIDAIPSSWNVSVSPAVILVITASSSRTFYLPHDACHWMRDFDAGKPVQPFSFQADEQ